MIQPTFHNQSGFTLVEVLVAISLLLMVIVGPMQILTRANNSTAFATEQQTAWLLAQEGLEMAQLGRDNLLLRWFNGDITNPWARFRTDYTACFQATGCGLSVSNAGLPTIVSCNPVTNCQLYLSTTTDRASYQHVAAGNVRVPYTRVIKMAQVGGAFREVIATSTVTWRTGSLIAGQKVETATFLFNIYAAP